MRAWQLIVLVIIHLVVGGVANAATIRIISSKQAFSTGFNDVPPCNLRLKGRITRGDADKLRTAVTQLKFRHGLRLCLNSKGGSYKEALLLAEFGLKNFVATTIPDKAVCYSACSIVFMAGLSPQEEEGKVSDRSLHVGGKLGFHVPSIAVADGKYDKNDVFKVYRSAVGGVQKLVKLGRGLGIGVDVVPKSLIGEMLATEPNDFYLIDTVYRAMRFGIDLFGYRSIRKVSSRDLCNACRNFFAPRYGETANLGNRSYCKHYSSKSIRMRKRREIDIYIIGEGLSCIVRADAPYGGPLAWHILPELSSSDRKHDDVVREFQEIARNKDLYLPTEAKLIDLRRR